MTMSYVTLYGDRRGALQVSLWAAHLVDSTGRYSAHEFARATSLDEFVRLARHVTHSVGKTHDTILDEERLGYLYE
jgi:hypothetical protein